MMDTQHIKNTWHILGPGAIGSLFGCHLVNAGLQVHFLGREQHPAIRRITLSENSMEQDFDFPPPTPSPIEQLLITVKSHQTQAALDAIAPHLTEDALVLFLQNGMGAWQIVDSLSPSLRVLLATTTEGAHRPTANKVIHAGRGQTWIGALHPENQPLAQDVSQQWDKTGLDIDADDHIIARLWQKLAINCAINPLTALYDCPNGELLNNPDALTNMEAICIEVEQVMGRVLGESITHLFELAQQVAQNTAGNISSMLQDVRHQRSTEIDYITGYLLEQASRHGVHCPFNQSLYFKIKQL